MSMESGLAMMQSYALMLKMPTPTKSLELYLIWARKKLMKPSMLLTKPGQTGKVELPKRERSSSKNGLI